MIAKMTSKNQITLPKAIVQQIPGKYFDVRREADRIILTPLNIDAADQVRAKMEALGITEQDISDAVSWARR
jgi:bifunctional DNA-binding transcriptional regulator/antitoxin component of YhaV-PrlF toxin-antitoxin module